MSRKKTHAEFVAEVEALVGGEYTVLGKYRTTSLKLEMKHVNCGFIYEVTPNSFISGNRCPSCFGNKKRTTESFREELTILASNEYLLESDYVNSRIKVKVKHLDCGYAYEVRPDTFIRGARCPKCSGNARKTTEEFKKEVFEICGNEYTVLGEYVSSVKKIKIKHNVCSREYEASPNTFLRGKRCSHCFRKKKKNNRGI